MTDHIIENFVIKITPVFLFIINFEEVFRLCNNLVQNVFCRVVTMSIPTWSAVSHRSKGKTTTLFNASKASWKADLAGNIQKLFETTMNLLCCRNPRWLPYRSGTSNIVNNFNNVITVFVVRDHYYSGPSRNNTNKNCFGHPLFGFFRISFNLRINSLHVMCAIRLFCSL
jgi:hypothetical protein